jgi:hypothetical protein
LRKNAKRSKKPIGNEVNNNAGKPYGHV